MKNAAAYSSLGGLLTRIGRYGEGERCARQATRLAPEYADGFRALGINLARQGRDEEAETAFARAIALAPETPALGHHSLGALLHEQRLYQDAERWIRRGIQFDSGDPLLHLNLGCALAEQDKFGDAVKSFASAARMQPDDVEALLYLGKAHMRIGAWELAEGALKEALAATPEPSGSTTALPDVAQRQRAQVCSALSQVYVELARKFHEIDYFEETVEIADKGLQDLPDTSPEYTWLRLNRAFAKHGLGNVREAKSDLNAVVARARHNSPESLTARRNLGRLKRQKSYEYPSWLPYAIAVALIALVIYMAVNDQPATTLAGTVFGALVLAIAGFSLPVMTKLKVGGVELEKETTLTAIVALAPIPDRRSRFAMVQRARTEAERFEPPKDDNQPNTNEQQREGVVTGDLSTPEKPRFSAPSDPPT
jgi:tetratricopeptide (TPR) repeat protein